MGVDPRWEKIMRECGGIDDEPKHEPTASTDLQIIADIARNLGFRDCEYEYRFHESRRWRFDLAWPSLKVAFERDGWTRVFVPLKCKKCSSTNRYSKLVSRHTDPKGMSNDNEKLNTAQAMGWIVIRGTPEDMKSGAAREQLLAALFSRRKEIDERKAFQLGLEERIAGQSELLSKRTEK